MSDINLSSAVRSSLTSLQSTANLLSTTQERLATGNSVNSALDDPTAFFTATALNDRASDLSTLLDEQGQAIQVIEAADNGISAIQDLVDSARAIATQALQTDSQSERATLAGQFDDILGQIEDLAGDASFNGINLLDSTNSQDLEVIFNEDGSSSLTVGGVNFTDVTADLGLQRQSFTGGGGAASTTSAIDIAGLSTTGTLSIDADGTGAAAAIDIDLAAVSGGTAQTDASLTTSGFDVSNVTSGDTITITGTDGAGDPQTSTITFGDGTGGTVDIAGITDQASLVSAVQGAADTAFGTGNVTVADNGGELDIGSTTGDVSFAFNDADGSSAPAQNASAAAGTDFVAQANGTVSSGAFDPTAIATGDALTITVDDGVNPATNVTINFGDGTGGTVDVASITDEASLIAAIDTAANTAGLTAAGGTDLAVTATGGAGAGLDLSSDIGNVSFALTDASAGGNDVTVPAGTDFNAGTAGTSTTTGFDVANVTAGDTIAITVDDGVNPASTTTVTFGDGTGGTVDISSITDQASLVAALDTAAGGNTTVTDASGEIALSSTAGNVSLAFNDTDTPATTPGTVATQTTAAGADGTAFSAEVAGTLTQEALVSAINTAGAASGITATADGTTGFTISSTTGNATVSGAGLAATETGTGFVAGSGTNFSTNADVSATLDAIDSALGTIRTAASTLGTNLSTIQIRSDFTSDLINTLEVGAGNLTLADLNEEGANLLTLQTRQQLASTSLSFATQADGAVLSLF